MLKTEQEVLMGTFLTSHLFLCSCWYKVYEVYVCMCIHVHYVLMCVYVLCVYTQCTQIDIM